MVQNQYELYENALRPVLFAMSSEWLPVMPGRDRPTSQRFCA
jgi:hypothetical protein